MLIMITKYIDSTRKLCHCVAILSQ